MKVFWSLLAALIILTVFLMVTNSENGVDAGNEGSAAINATTPPGDSSATRSEPREGASSSSSGATSASEGSRSSSAGSTAETEPLDAPETGETSGTSTETPSSPGAPQETGTTASPAPIEQRDDGATVLDGRFVIRGSGTDDDPYVVPWDLLVSAQDSYQPRLGKTDIPSRIDLLDGKQVKITGYIAFPLMVSQANELLLMMNQWDGCCVGVPPTPYDGIEVRLSRAVPATSGINVFHYGSITGTFKVDPYIVNNWLVGMYLIEEASLEMEM